MDAGRRVLTVGAGGGDPGDRGQGAGLRRIEVGMQPLDVVQLVILADISEERQRVPDPGRPGALLDRSTSHRGVVRTIGLGALLDVIPPAHVLGVQQPGDIGPGQVNLCRAGCQLFVDELVELRRLVRPVDVVDAARGRTTGTLRGPRGHHVQMGRQRPRFHGLEHAIVENEVLGVRPVVRDLGCGVVSHHVGRGAGVARGIVDVEALGAALGAHSHEPVHLPASFVGDGIGHAVRAAAIDVGGVVVGPGTRALWVRQAHRRRPVLHGNAVRPWVGAEVVIERPVLLHDDDHVLDLVDARFVARRRRVRRPLHLRAPGTRGEATGQEYRGGRQIQQPSPAGPRHRVPPRTITAPSVPGQMQGPADTITSLSPADHPGAVSA